MVVACSYKILWPKIDFLIFLPHFPLSTGHFFKCKPPHKNPFFLGQTFFLCIDPVAFNVICWSDHFWLWGPALIYMVLCKKSTGVCARVKPTYIGMCGERESSSFTHKLGSHMGTAIQNSQADTLKTVGRLFRLGLSVHVIYCRSEDGGWCWPPKYIISTMIVLL